MIVVAGRVSLLSAFLLLIALSSVDCVFFAVCFFFCCVLCLLLCAFSCCCCSSLSLQLPYSVILCELRGSQLLFLQFTISFFELPFSAVLRVLRGSMLLLFSPLRVPMPLRPRRP